MALIELLPPQRLPIKFSSECSNNGTLIYCRKYHICAFISCNKAKCGLLALSHCILNSGTARRRNGDIIRERNCNLNRKKGYCSRVDMVLTYMWELDSHTRQGQMPQGLMIMGWDITSGTQRVVQIRICCCHLLYISRQSKSKALAPTSQWPTFNNLKQAAHWEQCFPWIFWLVCVVTTASQFSGKCWFQGIIKKASTGLKT